MKKLSCMIMALALLLGSTAISASAEGTAEVHCQPEGFYTSVPEGMASRYEEGTGFVIYTENEGYIPYVIIHRRAPEKRFSNPVNYLNNVYREHMEEKYGDNMLGMNPAKEWEAGGKTLTGARYMYRVQDNTVCLVYLIEVREDGDVEYTAKYIDGQGDTTMAALDEAVRGYRLDEIAAATTPTETDGILLPEAVEGEADTQSGYYYADITDTDRIMDGGFFTVRLYEQSTYAEGAVKGLKPGSKVQIEDRVFTVDSLNENEDGYELIPREEFDGYIVFRYDTIGAYTVMVNDWVPGTFVAEYKVMMPLANKFSFGWLDPDGEATVYDADSFVKLVTKEGAAEDMNHYNTLLGFSDGLLTVILHSDYPQGPVQE